MLKGSTHIHLSWNYTLSEGSDLKTTTFSINDGSSWNDIGVIYHADNDIVIYNKNDYRTRFNISDSNVATLILKKVTEDERAIFQCKLSTLSNSWTYSILVNFTSKCQFGDIHLIASDALCKTPVLNHSRYFLLFNLPTIPNCVSLIKMSGFGIRTSPLYSICPKIYYYHDPTFKPSVELWKDFLFLIYSQDPL